jgi:beta-galactosidase
VFVTVTVADKDGRAVPRSDKRIRFTSTGPGRIVATDNGDATSFESFQSPSRKAFNGLALAIVRARPGAGGDIKVHVASDGLEGGTVSLRSQPYK